MKLYYKFPLKLELHKSSNATSERFQVKIVKDLNPLYLATYLAKARCQSMSSESVAEQMPLLMKKDLGRQGRHLKFLAEPWGLSGKKVNLVMSCLR